MSRTKYTKFATKHQARNEKMVITLVCI